MTSSLKRLIWEAYLAHAGVRWIASAFGVSVVEVEMVIRRRGR